MTLLERIFSRKIQRGFMFSGRKSKATLDLNPAEQLDVKLCRDLYWNRNQNYALAAQLVKPMINSTVGFIGIPEIETDDEKLADIFKTYDIPWELVHKMMDREGGVGVWPQWDQEEGRINFVVIPKETCIDKLIDPVSKKVWGYVFKEHVSYKDSSLEVKQTDITTIVTAEEVIRTKDGKRETIKNPFGKLPIVWFYNEKEPQDYEGHSEIENVEPMLRFYHEMLYEAGAAQKRDGHPKANIGTRDIGQWINNNYGAGTAAELVAGTKKIDLDDKDVYINGEGETGFNYVTASNNIGAAGILTERGFTNFVEGSETPEILFGANLGTSLASVKEQRPVWTKKIERKQRERNQYWMEVLKLAFSIQNFATFSATNIDFSLLWPVPDFKDEKESVAIMDTTIKSMAQAKAAHLLSDKEIHDSLKYVPNIILEDNYKKHEKLVEDTVKEEQKRSMTETDQDIVDEMEAEEGAADNG